MSPSLTRRSPVRGDVNGPATRHYDKRRNGRARAKERQRLSTPPGDWDPPRHEEDFRNQANGVRRREGLRALFPYLGSGTAAPAQGSGAATPSPSAATPAARPAQTCRKPRVRCNATCAAIGAWKPKCRFGALGAPYRHLTAASWRRLQVVHRGSTPSAIRRCRGWALDGGGARVRAGRAAQPPLVRRADRDPPPLPPRFLRRLVALHASAVTRSAPRSGHETEVQKFVAERRIS